MTSIDPVFDWLVEGAPGSATASDVFAHLGSGLLAAGIPIARLMVFVTTLHPSVLGRFFLWKPGQPVVVSELPLSLLQEPRYQLSPIGETIRGKAELRRRIYQGVDPADYLVVHELAAAGITDYLCLPVRFTSGQSHALTLATAHPTGFSDEQVAAVRRLVHPFARVAEIFAQRRTAANLLNTYVGRNCGERILAGNIVKGDIETISAVIWFSDLRGFTELSGRLSSRQIIDILNELFDCQVPAIESHGGEVLKFIGDGLLAIFPVQSTAVLPVRCDAALAAAADAFAALAQRNLHAQQHIKFGLALHVGEIAYGNIGGAMRLDFTAIGPAVNLAARLEGLTGKLGQPLVVSQDFADYTSRPLELLGTFELKGVTSAQRIYVPARQPQ